MSLPDEAPKLPPWPFLVGDAVLIGAAYFIANESPHPLVGVPLILVAACVIVGAVVAIIPFLLNYTRRQELALAERQSEIAALAQTTATSAEQLSIAAAGLHGIVEAANKSLKHAEQLPARLQEKVNEFKSQLNEVAVTENESLAQEIATLRASETERLESALTAIKKTAAEIAQRESAAGRALADLNENLRQFSEQAHKSATEQTVAFSVLRKESERSLQSAEERALKSIEKSLRAALDEFARHSAALAVIPTPAAERNHLPDTPAPAPAPRPVAAGPVAAGAAPIPAATPTPEDAPVPAVPAPRDTAAPVLTEAPKPPRKRAPRREIADGGDLSLGLELPEPAHSVDYSQEADSGSSVAVSADGYTRLIVTAYIGIGNKLFIRGDAPGLSWEKGVPLQFVSIGKWRWETGEPLESAQVKLLKNDEVEPTNLAEIRLQPGHQHEFIARF